MRCGDATISRAELLTLSRTWECVLARQGCAREVPVGVLIPRGIDALVAILAILRSGGAYVPLPWGDSPERLQAILDDCGRPLVVAAEGTAENLPWYSGRVIGLTELRQRARSIRPDDTP